MKKLNQSGFTAVEALLVLILAAILGFAGYYVYHAQNSATKALDAADKSSAAQKVVPKTADPTAKWLIVNSKNGGFSVSIPDGWAGVNYGGADQFRFTSITYKPGAKVTISDADSPYAGDSEVPLSVTLEKTAGPDTALLADAVVTDYDLGSYDGTKFYKLFTEDTPEGVGARHKGDADYAYRIDISRTEVLYIYYSVKAGQADQHALIEQFISGIKLN